MIIDLTFTHQRPQAIASYWSLGAVLSNFILVFSPTIVDSKWTWRAFYFYLSPFCFLAVILAFLFCPETYFQRPAVAFDGHVLEQSATEGVKIYEGWDEIPDGKPLPDRPLTVWDKVLGIFRPWGTGKGGGWSSLRACCGQVLLCTMNPMIFWVLILNTLVFEGVVLVGSTYVSLLSAPPYNLSMNVVVYGSIAAAIGSLLAWPASGVLTARICLRLTARNKGVRDVEHYLPSFILPIAASATGLVLFGVAGQNYWHWMWVLFAQGLNYFGFIALFTSSTLWAAESFPRWAAAALIVVVGGSNVVSFGISFAIGPWISAQGFGLPYYETGAMILAVGFIGIAVAYYGKRWRMYMSARWDTSDGGALRPQV
jgi:Major Facilitator Superfamily